MLKPLENFINGYKQPATEYRNEYRTYSCGRPSVVRPDMDYVDNKRSVPMQSETTNRLIITFFFFSSKKIIKSFGYSNLTFEVINTEILFD